MKKFIYLCGMMLLSMNIMAQIDLNDRNWKNVFNDTFSDSGRSWMNWISSPDKKWRGYNGSGVTNGTLEHQVYQYSNCVFNLAEGTMELVAEYDSDGCIPSNCYVLPSWMNGNFPSSDGLYYFSGEIDARKDSVFGQDTKFLYGYFEIRCKLPKHRGAFPAFWLRGSSKDISDPYYEEIDIFEYTWSIGDPLHHWAYSNPDPTYAGDPYVISTGIYHNLHGQYSDPNTDAYARNYPRLRGHDDVNGWHTYSCEWMPDHVYWYLDGQLVNSYYNVAHIPRHPLTLKANYAINRYALDNYNNNGNPEWLDSDTMTIDYIKAYQLDWDCESDAVITCQSDLNSFVFKVKKTVSITSYNGSITLGNTEKATFRVTDSFELSGPFQADSGCELTVIKQDCQTQ